MGEAENQHDSNPKYDCLLFDLDDTLYPFSSGLSAEVTKNIQKYMIQKLEIDENIVPELCLSLYKLYGTTMAGLRAIGYKFDYDDFHSYVHGQLPYEILSPDPNLRSLLLSIPIRKVIFTNADTPHARRVLSRLELEDCFDGIISFDTLNDTSKGNDLVDNVEGIFDINDYTSIPNAGIELPKSTVVCKPFEEAYEQTFRIAGIDRQRTIFFDDSVRNLQTAKRLGLETVRVGSSDRAEGVDHALESIHNIKEAIPELWEDNEESQGINYSGEVAIETLLVRA